jgi:nucleotidyltransferase substrate binding protein (TIGR01987 family)
MSVNQKMLFLIKILDMIETNEPDIRWKQRFANYKKALNQLQKFVDKGELNELEEQGLVQAFEFTHELAWNVMRDYFYYQGNTDINGSRDATREAFKNGLVVDGEGWMEMIKSRNQSSHTYNEEVIVEIRGKILNYYYRLFVDFSSKMSSYL